MKKLFKKSGKLKLLSLVLFLTCVSNEVLSVGLTKGSMLLAHCSESAKRFLFDQLSDNDTTLTLSNFSINDSCGSDIVDYLRSNHKPILTLVMSNNTLAQGTANAFIQWFSDDSSPLLTLDLSNNNFSPSSTLKLSKSIGKSSVLSSFVYKGNDLGVLTPSDLKLFMRGFSHLKSLDFSYNNIESNMVEGLVDSIDKMSSLTNLNLSYNPLADSGLKLLSNALPAMAHLSTLHLDFVKSGTVGAEALINALENRVNPMTLSFKRNYYSDAAFKQFQALNDGFIDIML